MEFHVIRTSILAELQLMMGFIEKKNTMPILANIYLKAENNQLILKATDLEMGIITEVAAQVIEGGELTVHAKKLHEMLNTLSDEQVSFILDDSGLLHIKCGTAEFSIETMSSQDYPTIPEYGFEDAIEVQNGLFKKCLDRVLFSISNDAHKYALNGALFKIEKNEMILVSTDSHRLSVVTKNLPQETSDISVIIPRKSVIELKRSLGVEPDEDGFKIGLFDNRVFFLTGVRVLFSRLIDGNFPDYTKAIPQNNDKSFVFDRSKLVEVLRRKMVLTSDKSRLVRFSFAENKCKVSLQNAERGHSVDEIPIEYDDAPVNVGFNVLYVSEFLKAMDTAKVEVFLKDEFNQGLFKLVDDPVDFGYQHVIMPMRLTGS